MSLLWMDLPGKSWEILQFHLISIYDALMRPLLHSVGLWQQDRVDNDTEFVFVLRAQQHLATQQPWQDRLPVSKIIGLSVCGLKSIKILVEMEANDEQNL